MLRHYELVVGTCIHEWLDVLVDDRCQPRRCLLLNPTRRVENHVSPGALAQAMEVFSPNRIYVWRVRRRLQFEEAGAPVGQARPPLLPLPTRSEVVVSGVPVVTVR